MLDRFFAIARLHTLALLCWAVAFMFWRDYLTHPHQPVARDQLVSFTGTFSASGTLVSLPSGTQGGRYLILKESKRSLSIASAAEFLEFQGRVSEGEPVTIQHSPDVDLGRPGNEAVAFSLRYNHKDYIDTDQRIHTYNEALRKQVKTAGATTLGGFVIFGLVEFIRRKFLKR